MSVSERQHDLLCRGDDCHGFYDELCGAEECHGCIPTHCPCQCHAEDPPCKACTWRYGEGS